MRLLLGETYGYGDLLFPFVSYIHLSGGWGPRNSLSIKYLALQYGSHAT
jgi:hypothetical protein